MTKKVRLTAPEAELLARLAKDRETSESEILRKGLRLQRRMKRRSENIEALVELVEAEEPEKVRFPLED